MLAAAIALGRPVRAARHTAGGLFHFSGAVGRLDLGASNVAMLSRFLRQAVAKGINGMSHQHADAQNEARSYKHELPPRSKRIREDEHMHSQKKSEIRRDLIETRCALATATYLQHSERLAEARSP